jgi:rod shape determining protein RodA
MRDPFGAGYQIIQSRIAIGSGGFWGKGFLMGTQKNLNFLPEHHTDFIFSVIGEEFGFLGCAIILLIYFLFLYRFVRNINALKRKEFRFAAIGILAYLTFQIFINIGMNIGIVPTTGIPLPFISYGGSNLLINVLAIGLVLKFLNERSIFE